MLGVVIATDAIGARCGGNTKTPTLALGKRMKEEILDEAARLVKMAWCTYDQCVAHGCDTKIQTSLRRLSGELECFYLELIERLPPGL